MEAKMLILWHNERSRDAENAAFMRTIGAREETLVEYASIRIKPELYKRIPGDHKNFPFHNDEYHDVIDGISFNSDDTLLVEFLNKEENVSILHFWFMDIDNNAIKFWDDMQTKVNHVLMGNLDKQTTLSYVFNRKSFGAIAPCEEGLYTEESRADENKKFFLANNKIYLTTPRKDFLEIRESETNKLLYSSQVHKNICNIAINKSGTLFAVSTGKTVYIFKTALEIVKNWDIQKINSEILEK